MPLQLPTDQERSDVALRLQDVIDSIIEHPSWKPPPNQNPTLYHIWDFVMRSKYMLSEYDNIKAKRPVEFPDRFLEGVGLGDTAAMKMFQDVCGRTMMLDLLVNDTTGKTAMITGNTGPAVDFGDRVKEAVKALGNACPKAAFMAGLRN